MIWQGLDRSRAPIDRAWIITAGSAILVGLTWIAKDLSARVSPDADYWDCNSSYDYVLNGVDTVAFLVQGVTLLGLYKLFGTTMSVRRALIGIAAAAGFGVAGVANVLEHCAGLDALGFAYVIGLMVGMLLLLTFELALTRVGIPTWCTGVLILGTVAGVLIVNQGGLILFGCSWILFGSALVLNRPGLHTDSAP